MASAFSFALTSTGATARSRARRAAPTARADRVSQAGAEPEAWPEDALATHCAGCTSTHSHANVLATAADHQVQTTVLASTTWRSIYELVRRREARRGQPRALIPGLTPEPSSLPAALLAAACCCSLLAFLMISLMAFLIASLIAPMMYDLPLIPPLIASLITKSAPRHGEGGQRPTRRAAPSPESDPAPPEIGRGSKRALTHRAGKSNRLM